ncbi:centromere protein T [Hippoglossus hippoglossus]|uniref:centromere protein T n=1 Tax=Hippoglossus hippoglossus TaxID=8267 RepID=UPI00148C9C0A|nr:centromere protein T [Hippoglossus hippoglossus]
MDLTEDLSARVLLKNILSTETPRTPITRSASKELSPSRTRSSSRLSRRDAGAHTPQDILRRSLKHKMRESITRKSLPTTTRRTASAGPRKMQTPAPTSMLFDEGDTPRHMLRNILLTEPVRSPVVHEKAASEEPQLPSADSSISSKRPSIELSGLDLPDLTFGNAASIAKGLSRKRPHRSLNVTAFEKRLKGASDVGEESDVSISDHSSLSLTSSTSLGLKTPFVDMRTERRGLQRRVANRRKITEEEFGAGVNKWHMGDDHDQPQDLNMTTYSEGFHLGLSVLSEPDISTDIVNCNTALYTEPNSMMSSSSIGQDKGESRDMEPTEGGVAAEPQSEECVSEDQSEKVVDTAEEVEMKSTSESQHSEEEENRVEAQTEEEGATDSQTEGNAASRSHSEEEEVAPDSQTEGEEDVVDSQPEEDVAARSEEEEEEVAPDSQTEEEKDVVDSQPEEDVAARSEEEEEEVAPDSQTEEEKDVVDSQPEEDVAARSEEEEVAPDSQTEEEEDVVDSQPEEDVAARSESEEEEVAPESQTEEEEGAVDSPSEEDVEAGSQSEAAADEEEYQSDQEDPAANSQSEEDKSVVEDEQEEEEEEEEEGEQASELLEHISRRVQRSQGGLIMPVAGAGGDLPDATEEGWSEGKAHAAIEPSESSHPHSEMPDVGESSTRGQNDDSESETESDAGKENPPLPLELTNDIVDGDHLSDAASEEEAAAMDPAEPEEEWEDEDGEENEDFRCETPAFVKEKRNFFHLDPQASPSVLKNIQTSSTSGTSEALPAAKPKQVQRRKRAPAKKNTTLPKSYLMNAFRHFAKAKVSADVYPVLDEVMDKFFERLADDLETYAGHAKRKTIEVEDVVLLLKRQGHVNDKVPVEVLIEKYLRMEQRKLLIPIATSGNVVIPKKQI